MKKKGRFLKSNSIYEYSYGKKLSSGLFTAFIFLGIILFGFAINLTNIITVSILIIYLVLFSVSLLPTEVLQVNFKTKEYRIVTKVLNVYSKAEWKTLQYVQYLSIVLADYIVSKITPNITSKNSHKYSSYELRFFVKSGYYFIIDTFNSKENAIHIGLDIAKGLDLNILDATITPPEFIHNKTLK